MFLQPDAVVQQLFQKLYFLPGMRVCDIGCGGGYFSALLAEKLGPEGRVYAVDIQEDAVKETQELAHVLGLHTIICSKQDGRHTSFERNFFQGVFLSQLRTGEKDNVLFLQEAKRITCPKGIIVVVEQKKTTTFLKVEERAVQRVQENIKEAGLALVEIIELSDNYSVLIAQVISIA